MGAGSSYGIIVSLEIKARKLYPNPVFYLYQFNRPTLDEAVASFSAFQAYGVKQAPPELSIRIRMGLPSNLVLQGPWSMIFMLHSFASPIQCVCLGIDKKIDMMQAFTMDP